DYLIGGPGNNTIKGGDGSDFVDYLKATGPMTIDFAAGQATGQGTDVLTSVEGAEGSAFRDAIRGNTADNFIDGSKGDDTIEGRGGDDVLGGDEGRDLVSYASASAAVVVTLGTYAPPGQFGGEGSATGGEGTDKLYDFDDIEGSKFGDTLTGNAGDNLLR